MSEIHKSYDTHIDLSKHPREYKEEIGRRLTNSCIYTFDNGYHLSIVYGDFTYGNEDGLLEVLISKKNEDGIYKTCEDVSELTDEGNPVVLTEDEVTDLVEKVKKLQ